MKWEVEIRASVDVEAENDAEAINKAFRKFESYGMKQGGVIFTTYPKMLIIGIK